MDTTFMKYKRFFHRLIQVTWARLCNIFQWIIFLLFSYSSQYHVQGGYSIGNNLKEMEKQFHCANSIPVFFFSLQIKTSGLQNASAFLFLRLLPYFSLVFNAYFSYFTVSSETTEFRVHLINWALNVLVFIYLEML